jgi:microcystin-dependent protein
MSNFFIGEVRPFAGPFAPANWTFCNGQLMSIAQNTTLFALLGTTYGGDGISTFALPNLQGRLALHQGTGLGLSPRTLGEIGGTPTVTLLQGNMPAHFHSLNATTANATAASVGPTLLPAKTVAANSHLYTTQGASAPTPEVLSGQACGTAGQSLPHENMMPSLALSYVISLVGIFPSRN